MIATLSTAAVEETGPAAPEACPAPPTVLVVDDCCVDRRLVTGLLARSLGLRTADADGGEGALAAIERERPSVVVTDLQMPGMDGLALVEAIRRRYPEVPVVLMTGHGSEEAAMNALRAGAASYVPKRALATELVPTLRRVLSLAAPGRDRLRLQAAWRERTSAFEIPNDPDLVAPLVALLRQDLDALGFGDETARTRVAVALHEALANALFHGNLEVSSDLRQDDERVFYAEADRRRLLPTYAARRLHVRAALTPEAAVYTVRDEGPGFDASKMRAPIDTDDLMRIGGRGLLLIRTFMDEVTHNPAGNEITLVKRRPSPR